MKLFSEKRLEDFNIRWNEVFKDRVEDLETFLNSKSKGKENETNNLTNNRSCNKEESWKTLEQLHVCEISDKFTLFKEILFDEKLSDPSVEMTVDKKECCNVSETQNGNDELITLCINVALKNDKTKNCTGDGYDVYKTFIVCRMPVESVFHELSKNIIQKMLLKKLKKILKNERLKSRYEYPKKKTFRSIKSSNHQRSFFFYDNDANDIQSKMESNVVSVEMGYFHQYI